MDRRYSIERFLVSLILLIAGIGDIVGQTITPKDSSTNKASEVAIHFRINSHLVDSVHLNNQEAVALLACITNSQLSSHRLDSIVITAISSPEGNPLFNAWLTQQRAEAVRKYLVHQHPTLDTVKIITYSYPQTWEGIREVIESDSSIPAVRELLRIISTPGLGEFEKEQQIRAIAGRKTFPYLNRNLFPLLRKGTISFNFHPLPTEETPPPIITEEVSPVPPVNVVEEPINEPPVDIKEEPKLEKIVSPTDIKYIFALRSNLLSDLIQAPNIGIEVPIGNHFSVAADFTYAYWQMKNDHFALQTIQGNVEGRYWLQWKDTPLTGWNLGVYATFGGRYDIQWNTGYQGDRFWTTGLVGGYSLSLSKKFNLDFSLAVGYMGTPEVRVYNRPQDGHLIWKETRYNTGMFSVTKARVGLVWLLGTRKY